VNQNQFYYLVANALLCSIALVIEDSLPVGMRIGSALPAVVEAYLIMEGLTLSAILMPGPRVSLSTTLIVQSHSGWVRATFAIATLVAGVVGLASSTRYWDFIYLQRSFGLRTRQYTAAIHWGALFRRLISRSRVLNGAFHVSHRRFHDKFTELTEPGSRPQGIAVAMTQAEKHRLSV
jgi:hypothetical protein